MKEGFHRTVTGIVLKRKRQRLPSNLKGQSAHGLSDCFGVDSKTICEWIASGKLKAEKRGTNRTDRQGGDIWFIKDRCIRNFIINYISEVDFRKVDKYWLVDILTGEGI